MAVLSMPKSFDAFDASKSEAEVRTFLASTYPDIVALAEADVRSHEVPDEEAASTSEARVAAAIHEKLKVGFDRIRTSSMCPQIDFDRWASAFRRAVEQLPSESAKCIDAQWNRYAAEQSWTPDMLRRVKKDRNWASQNQMFSYSCSVVLELRIETMFRERFDLATKLCRDMSFRIPSILLSDSPISIPKSPSLLPPTDEEVALMFAEPLE